MNPVVKALWFIESHFAGDLTLAEISAVAGVSRFHMVRGFGVTTGHSVMRYVRGRRLSEAARRLAKGAPDIMTVALDVGYGSHGACPRAFRDQFGLTPDRVRARGNVETLLLVEPFRMENIQNPLLGAPRIVDGAALLIAGLVQHFSFENMAGIQALRQVFREHIGNVPRQVGQTAYDVCYKTDDAGHFDCLAGVELADFSALPKDFVWLRLSEQRYAVFLHEGHVATVRGTFMAIFNDWLPRSGYKNAVAAPFERYGESFDARTGLGGFEVWIPIKA